LLSNQDIACRFSYELSANDQEKDWLNLVCFRENEPISRFFSLKHRGILRINYGDHCEEFRILMRIHDLPWSVVRLEKDRLSANFQGNPCWPQIILAPYQHLSDYLGLSQSVRENVCFVPTIETINQKIKDLLLGAAPLNEDLFFFCDESRYERCTSPGLSDKSYVDTFIDFGYLPMGNLNSLDSIHDWSYHFISLMFPQLLKNIRSTLRVIRDHVSKFVGSTSYVWNYYGHTLDKDGKFRATQKLEHMNYDSAIYRQMAVSLDVGTAKIIQLLMAERNGLLNQVSTEIAWCELFMTGVHLDGIKSLLYLENGLEKIFSPKVSGKGGYNGHLIPDCHHWLARLDDQATLLNDTRKVAFRKRAFEGLHL
jgi:hypothetical protein